MADALTLTVSLVLLLEYAIITNFAIMLSSPVHKADLLFSKIYNLDNYGLYNYKEK